MMTSRSAALIWAAAVLFVAVARAQEDDHDDHDDEHDHAHEDHASSSSAWGYSMAAVFLVSAISLAGVSLMAFSRERVGRWVLPLIGLSAGSLLGTSFFTLLPETTETVGFDLDVSCIVFAGAAFGYVSERLFHTHAHVHADDGHHKAAGSPSGADSPSSASLIKDKGENTSNGTATDAASAPAACELVERVETAEADLERAQSSDFAAKEVGEAERRLEHERRHLAFLSLSGDAVHNFVDGALIAATFIESPSTGVMTTIAIALHELPQEMGDFCVLLHAGFSTKQAIISNFLVALTSVAGGVLTLLLNESSVSNVTNYFLPFAAGLFIYLALADLLPEINKAAERKQQRYATFAMVCGVGIMALLLLFPDSHDH